MPRIERVTFTQVDDDNSTNRAALPSSKLFSGFDAEKFAPWALAGLLCYAIVRSFLEAAVRPFWYDELCTWVMVHQPNLSSMWSALAHGVDGQPPGFYVVEWLASHLSKNDQIAFRIPSIIGFCCTTVCLFVFVRRRSGAINALLWASIPLFSVLLDTYAVEARPYSLVVACISFALVCYQRAPAARWMILMGLSLACAQALHYYAVITFVPFIAAEAVMLLRNRRVRLNVWLALAFAFVPLICFWSLLSRFRAFYGSHFWSLPSFHATEVTYSWFFDTSFTVGLILAWGSLFAVLGKMLLAERSAARMKDPPIEKGPPTDFLHEYVLTFALLSLPFVALALAEIAHGGLTTRYALSAVLGFPLAATYIIPRLKNERIATLSILALLLALTVHESKFWLYYDAHPPNPAVTIQRFVASAGYPDLPVVVSDAIQFLPLTYYASPEWHKRFVMIVDPPESVSYAGSDSTDKEMQAMRDYSTIQVYDFQPFAAQHPTFLLFSSNAGFGDDWWPTRLFRDGYMLKMVAIEDPFHRIYLVTRGNGHTR